MSHFQPSLNRSTDLAMLLIVLTIGFGFGICRWVDVQIEKKDRRPAQVVASIDRIPTLDFGCLDQDRATVRVWRTEDSTAPIKMVGRFCETGHSRPRIPKVKVSHLQSKREIPIFVKLVDRSFITPSINLSAKENTFEVTWEESGQIQRVIAQVQ